MAPAGPAWAGTAPPRAAKRLHRVVVRVRPAARPVPRQRERVDHRPRPGLHVKVIKRAQHRLAVCTCRGSVTAARRRPAGHRVRRTRGAPAPGGTTQLPAPAVGLGSQLNPPAIIPRLSPGRLVPRHLDRPGEPEPAQQVHPVRAMRRPRLAEARPARRRTPPPAPPPGRPHPPAGTARTNPRSAPGDRAAPPPAAPDPAAHPPSPSWQATVTARLPLPAPEQRKLTI